nr:hypothetical protein [Tanacetum cinerariifolium]
LSDGGSPRVIVYGYDGLPMLPVAPPSLDYVPGPEEPQTPPAPQDEDKHERMFIQPHDPDFVPEPIYPEYIPLEDEHVLPAKEQPLPLVVSPTTESPEYVAESDPEEDPEEYEDDEIEDGSVDYPMDEGDDGDDDDGDSSGDDADNEDKDEEEHLASADSAIVIPTDELAAISLPPEAERLARCTTPAALPSPPLPPPLHTPPHADRRHDILETEMPPRKRLCLSTLGFREVGYGIRDTWVDPTETVPEVAPMTVGEVNTRVTELAELHEHDTQDLYALLVDAQDSVYTRVRTLGTPDTCTVAGRQAQMVETLQVIGDVRREMGDMQAELLAQREQPRRARQPGGDARVPNHQDAPRDADSHI